MADTASLLIELEEAVAKGNPESCLRALWHATDQLARKFASDDCIEVAGPILKRSERLDTETLIACARTKSQQHLLAISKRRSVPELVTDVLVVRGSNEVVSSVAANNGANFSSSGFLHLVRRSEGDSILAESVGLRKDIPRHCFIS